MSNSREIFYKEIDNKNPSDGMLSSFVLQLLIVQAQVMIRLLVLYSIQ